MENKESHIEKTRSDTLKSDVYGQRSFDDLKDLPPDGGIIAKRKRGRVIASIPSVSTTDLEGNRVVQTQTRRGMKPNNPIDKYIEESIRQGSEPGEGIRNAAIRYLHAKGRGILKHAEKKQKDQNG